MEKNSSKELIKNKISAQVSNLNKIKSIKIDKRMTKENKNQKKNSKKYSLDIPELNMINTNNSREQRKNIQESLLEQKQILKTEIVNNEKKINSQKKELKNFDLKDVKFLKEDYNNIKYYNNQHEFHTINYIEKNSKKNLGIKSNEYKIKIEEKKNQNSKERKNSKETFGTILLNKKIRLFSFSNDPENNNDNNYSMNVKESTLISNSPKIEKNVNFKKINRKKPLISIKKNTDKSKISYKKLKLELNKDNNKYNGENNDKDKLKYEVKIKQNKEILFNSKNEDLIEKKSVISKPRKNTFNKNDIVIKLVQKKEKKKEINKGLDNQKSYVKNSYVKKDNNDASKGNIIVMPNKKDKKSNNSKKNLNEKNKEIKIQNKIENKEKIGINKVKVINFNFKKNFSPIRINISLNNNLSENNDNLFLLTEKNSIMNIEKNISKLLKSHKNPKIHKNIFNEEINEKTEDKLTKKDNKTLIKEKSENYRKNKTSNKNFKISKFGTGKKMENKKRNIDNYKNDLILPLNTIEISAFRLSNKLFRNNHYKSFLNDIAYESMTQKLNPRKKFRFSERKKNAKNKILRMRLTESTENYYDLYKKVFDDISLEQKFIFNPKNTNKKYFNSGYNDDIKNNNEINISFENKRKFDKKISSNSFKSKKEDKPEKKLNISTYIDKKELNENLININKNINIKDFTNDFDINKNSILDLNHIIPIDKEKLINLIE